MTELTITQQQCAESIRKHHGDELAEEFIQAVEEYNEEEQNGVEE